jgi:hypothetical protein
MNPLEWYKRKHLESIEKYIGNLLNKKLDWLLIKTEAEEPELLEDYKFLPEWQQASVAEIKKFEEDNGVTVEDY